MKNQLFIPSKIRVGYQERSGTYTGQLAYVIYYDEKNKLRKETSWQSWRDKKIEPADFDNTPMEGFVLNKKVGGYKSDWNFRQAYVRIYDPRGFEFEITVENLLFILSVCDCSRGKGLEGKFVYSWSGTDLVLLPENCETYQKCQNFTKLQGKKVSAKSLVEGYTYKTKREGSLVYLGKFEKHIPIVSYDEKGIREKGSNKKKYFVFWGLDSKDFIFLSSLTNLAEVESDAVHPDYASLVQKYNKSSHGSEVASIAFKDGDTTEYGFVIPKPDGSYYICSHHIDRRWDHGTNTYKNVVLDDYITIAGSIRVENGQLIYAHEFGYSYQSEEAKRKCGWSRYHNAITYPHGIVADKMDKVPCLKFASGSTRKLKLWYSNLEVE